MTNELHPGEVLTAETVGLLRAGDLLRGCWDGSIWSLERLSIAGRLVVKRPYKGTTESARDEIDAFTFIGRPNAEGWIDAPEGGWKTNPVPGCRVDIRHRGYQGDGVGYLSDDQQWQWDCHPGHASNILSFRLSASDEGRGSAHPQEAASVPGEGGGNPLDGAFITTRSVGNPEAAKREASLRFTFYGENSLTRVHALRDYLEALVASDRLTHPAIENEPKAPEQKDSAGGEDQDEVQVHHTVRRACDASGSVSAWARANGLSYEQVRLFLKGKRPPEPKLLQALGLERRTTYRANGSGQKGSDTGAAK